MTSKMLQILGYDGSIDTEADVDLADAELLKLYHIMLLTRTLDVKMLGLQRQGRIGFWIPVSGQEACHIGSAYALKPEDWIFLQYRELGAVLLRGVPLHTLIAQFFGNTSDLLKGRQMPCLYGYRTANCVVPSAPIATQIPQAVGAALAAQIRGDPIVTLVYFGDGATSANDFHTGMNFAGVFRTPTILLCQNNGWAISLPTERQTAVTELAVKAKAYGFEGIRVDGNDLLAVYKATTQAVEKARAGEGPTLIEAVTYRLGAHSTADDPTRYRGQSKVEEWKQRDPVRRFRLYLDKRGLWDDQREAALQQEIDREIVEAIREVERLPPPPAESLFDDVYATLPPHLAEQLQTLRSEMRPQPEAA